MLVQLEGYVSTDLMYQLKLCTDDIINMTSYSRTRDGVQDQLACEKGSVAILDSIHGI